VYIFQSVLHQSEQTMSGPENTLGTGESSIRTSLVFVLRLHGTERYHEEESLFGDLMKLIIVFTSNYYSNASIVDNVRQNYFVQF